jgi:hypothetical protein
MANELSVAIGGRLSKTLTILDSNDNAITSYTGSATLSIECWRGDDQASLFSPTAAWISAAAGTISCVISAAQSTTLTVGRYNLMLTVTGTDGPAKYQFGFLDVTPAPGSGTVRATYQTWDQTKRYAGSWAEKLQRADSDQTGFAEERADARQEFESLLHAHNRGSGGGLTSSFGAYEPLSTGRNGFRDSWLTTALAANKLLVTKPIIECCALMTLASICRRQIDPSKSDGYSAAASYFAARADDIAATISAEIDDNADGYGDVIIHLGTTDTLRG